MDELDAVNAYIFRGSLVEIIGEPGKVFFLRDGEKTATPVNNSPDLMLPLPPGKLVPDVESDETARSSGPDKSIPGGTFDSFDGGGSLDDDDDDDEYDEDIF